VRGRGPRREVAAKSYIAAVLHHTPEVDVLACSNRVITRRMAAALEQANIKDPAYELGDDIFREVLTFLVNSKDLAACLAVCRHWQQVADDTRLWRKHCQVTRSTRLMLLTCYMMYEMPLL
jgi:GH24 family phage-related lysozyme (muramidase)